jgi:hypothetical protein
MRRIAFNLLWLALPGLALAQTNLLKNGDFENGLSGWNLAGSGEARLAIPSLKGSEWALETTGWAWVQQDLKLKEQTRYSLRATVKARMDSCSVGIALGEQPGKPLLDKRLSFRGGWQTRELRFSLPQPNMWAAVFVSGGGEDCQFDNLVLSAEPGMVQPKPEQPIVFNGSFEAGLSGWTTATGELFKYAGIEGKQALLARRNTWVQQILPAGLLSSGHYWLKAQILHSGNGRCAVGLAWVNAEGEWRSELLVQVSTRPASWLEQSKALEVSSPPTWAALYLSAQSSNCGFDGIELLPSLSLQQP